MKDNFALDVFPTFLFFHYELGKKGFQEAYVFEDLLGHFDGTYQQ